MLRKGEKMECRIISDKVTALKKKRKKLYTNIIWSEIEKYQIEEVYENEKAIVFILTRREKKNIYFAATDIEGLKQLMVKVPKGGVLEYQCRKYNDMQDYFLDMGFEHYTNYIRVNYLYKENPYGKETGKRKLLAELYDPDCCEYASNGDIDEIDRMTRKMLDPIGDDIYTKEEWKAIIEKRECLLIKENERIVAYYVWRLEGKKYYVNMLVNMGPANLSYTLERKVFEKMWKNGIRMNYAWYDERNTMVLKRNNVLVNKNTGGEVYNCIYWKKR